MLVEFVRTMISKLFIINDKLTYFIDNINVNVYAGIRRIIL